MRRENSPLANLQTNSAAQSNSANRITFTLDLEDNLAETDLPARYLNATRRVLNLLDELGTSGTFFVVGQLARSQPELVSEIAARGHEIAYHSHAHKPLDRETVNNFRRETEADKNFIEGIIGRPVVGYRAPLWSLVKETVWAVDVLKELGFEYSSSVLPATNPLYGFAGAPTEPFYWPNGLLELPLPLASIGPVTLPFIGGIYLRYLFSPMQGMILRRIDRKSVLWTYCHPYDFDPGQAYVRADGLGFAMSFLLWRNRGGTFRKMKKLLGYGTAPAFATRVKSGEFENSIAAENLTV